MAVPTTLSELDGPGSIASTVFNQYKEKGISMLEQVSNSKYYVISTDPVKQEKEKEQMALYNKIKQDIQPSFKPALYIALRRTYEPEASEIIDALLMGGPKKLIETDPSVFPILDKEIGSSSVLDVNFISTELFQHIIDTLKELKGLPSPKGHHCFFYEVLALFYVTLLGTTTFNKAMGSQLDDYEAKYLAIEKKTMDTLTKRASLHDNKQLGVVINKTLTDTTLVPIKTIGDSKYYLIDNVSVKTRPLTDGYSKETMNHINLVLNSSIWQYVPDFIGGDDTQKDAVIVTEYISGLSLTDLINKGITDEEKKNIEACIRKAVNAFHNAGFLHLDIQPDNIIIRMDKNTIVPENEDPVVFINFEQSYWMSGSLVAYTSRDQYIQTKGTLVFDISKAPKITVLSEPLGEMSTPKFKSPKFVSWETQFATRDYSSGTVQNPATKRFSGEKYYFTQYDDNYAMGETISLLHAAPAPTTDRWDKPKVERLRTKENVAEDEEYDMNFYVFSKTMYDMRLQQRI